MRHFRRKPPREIQKKISAVAAVKCGATGKIMFKTHEAALERAAEIMGQDQTASLKRAYKCQYCGKYHITSQP